MNATQQSIDGEALAAVIAEWLDPNEVPHPALIAEILALVRPVEGYVLTREEAALVVKLVRLGFAGDGSDDPPASALAARLEAAQ